MEPCLDSGIEQLLQAVKLGMQEAGHDAFLFVGDLLEPIAAEYLLTVHVARCISKLNDSPGHPYTINIERSTQKFATDIQPLFRSETALGGGPPKRRLRKRRNVSRNGRIDIAVYDSRPPVPVPQYVIEVKGLDPSRHAVLQDLKRNAEFVAMARETDGGRPVSALLACLHGFPGSYDDAAREGHIEQLECRYGGWLSEVGDLRSLCTRVAAFPVRVVTEQDTVQEGVPDFASDENHHLVGVIVVLSGRGEAKSAG